jgi:hypothetical protein
VCAIQLHGGRTAHTRFGIPLKDLTSKSVSAISMQSAQGRLLAAAHLICWDETPMTHKNQMHCVDNTLKVCF